MLISPITKHGFTFIEVLVTTTIILLLLTIGTITFTQAGRGARDGRRKADIESIRQAMLLYKSEVGDYPEISPITFLIAGGYLNPPEPIDPQTGDAYEFESDGDPQTFCVCGEMENESNANSGSSCAFASPTKTHYCANQP